MEISQATNQIVLNHLNSIDETIGLTPPTGDDLSKINNNRSASKIFVTSIAKRRWTILAKALCQPIQPIDKTLTDEYLASSVRRFTTFSLFHKSDVISKPCENWCVYQASINDCDYSIDVHEMTQKFTPADLIGFNNTGNVCIWPSEECLAYFVLCNLSLFENRRVLELGGGMSCLAGMFLAKFARAQCVHMTDGNKLSIQNAEEILTRNMHSFTATAACTQLKWENVSDDGDLYDCIISADCLFFDGARLALINALWHRMKTDGFGLILAPCRGNTLDDFVQCAEQKGFNCNVIKCYNNVIWQSHLNLLNTNIYNENIHYPVLVEIRK